MATIKSYTSLEQSRKLTQILPLESADMYWDYDVQKHEYYPMVMDDQFDDTCICAWSLTALLSALPIEYINSKNEECGPLHIDITDSETPFVLWYVNPLHKGSIIELKTKECDNLVDACYEMILKLHELKML